MTIVWFIAWFVFDRIGDREVLEFAPVNWWAGALLLAVALDLGRQHAPAIPGGSRARSGDAG